LQDLAEPGGVCVSGSAYEQVRGKLDWALESLAGDCEMASLVGLSKLVPGQCGELPSIGMIDTAIDLEHDVLRDADIELVTPARELAHSPSGCRRARRDHDRVCLEVAALAGLGRVCGNVSRRSVFHYRDAMSVGWEFRHDGPRC
jgi:hypothetical protein